MLKNGLGRKVHASPLPGNGQSRSPLAYPQTLAVRPDTSRDHAALEHPEHESGANQTEGKWPNSIVATSTPTVETSPSIAPVRSGDG